MSLIFRVVRGKHAGKILTPHCHADGCFVISPTRFKADYVRLKHNVTFRLANQGLSPAHELPRPRAEPDHAGIDPDHLMSD